MRMTGLHWNEAGYAALSGRLAGRFQELDRVFLAWAEELGADDHRFPSLIALSDLKPLAYLRSFPHLATFATTLADDDQSLRDFADAHGESDSAPVDGEAGQLLTPAACYHFYPRLQDRSLDGDLYLTTCCACHRREEHYLPLERQWCFHMRELVCIGTREAVDAFVSHCSERIEDLVSRLQIPTRWQSATDPFFDPLRDPKALAQMVEPVKQELVLDDEGALAIGSINRHRSFFGECYGIRRDGEPAWSACVAFGLERWLAALSRQHGDDPEAWPALVEESA